MKKFLTEKSRPCAPLSSSFAASSRRWLCAQRTGAAKKRSRGERRVRQHIPPFPLFPLSYSRTCPHKDGENAWGRGRDDTSGARQTGQPCAGDARLAACSSFLWALAFAQPCGTKHEQQIVRRSRIVLYLNGSSCGCRILILQAKYSQGMDGCRNRRGNFSWHFVPWGTLSIQPDPGVGGSSSHRSKDSGRLPHWCRCRRKKTPPKKKIENYYTGKVAQMPHFPCVSFCNPVSCGRGRNANIALVYQQGKRG